jgi:hypothetical protein
MKRNFERLKFLAWLPLMGITALIFLLVFPLICVLENKDVAKRRAKK